MSEREYPPEVAWRMVACLALEPLYIQGAWRAWMFLAIVGFEGGGAMAAVNLRQVLIVDDNLALAENIAEILRLDGHTTRIAASAEEAFPGSHEDEPDVVVTDYRLPGMSGASFVKQLLATHTHIRAMVISAYTDDKTIDAATDAGATFMAKPLDVAVLGRWVCGDYP